MEYDATGQIYELSVKFINDILTKEEKNTPVNQLFGFVEHKKKTIDNSHEKIRLVSNRRTQNLGLHTVRVSEINTSLINKNMPEQDIVEAGDGSFVKFRIIPNKDNISEITKANVELMFTSYIDADDKEFNFTLTIAADVSVKKEYVSELGKSDDIKVKILTTNLFLMLYTYLRSNVNIVMKMMSIDADPLPVLNTYVDNLVMFNKGDSLRKTIKSSKLFVDFYGDINKE